MDVEHSRLLKFFAGSRQSKDKMAEAPEIPVIKIQKDYQSPPNVESEVPETHEIREFDEKNNSSEITGEEGNQSNSSEVLNEDANTSSEIKITGADFTLSPVITVTKKESTLTKGDMKLQKVTVTEDIAEEDSDNGGYRNSREILTQTDEQPDRITVESSERRTEEVDIDKMEGEEKSQDEKKSKIPMSRLRQAVERVKRERQAQKARGAQPRRSSIPILKETKVPIKRDASLNFTPAVDDEFDKLYEEIVDNKQIDVEEKLPSVTMEDPEKIETKFEEIIHAYDEDEHETQIVSRVSKIPALQRKNDDGSSRLGALIDRAKEKSTITESKLKDGGFKVTASSIRTKRFSRGNSRDLSSEQQIEVTETIDIKESGDNDVFVKETVVKTAPPKPERNFRNISKRIVAENKAGTIENKEGNIQTTVTENLDKKDGTLNKTKRFTRTVSRETRERNLNRELSRNLHEIRREFRNKIEDARLGDEDVDYMIDEKHVVNTEATAEELHMRPVKTEKIVRGISKAINDDGQNMNRTETVTVEEFDDGGTRTITTKTTENLIAGTPVITEKVIRNISREISSEGQKNLQEIKREFRNKIEDARLGDEDIDYMIDEKHVVNTEATADELHMSVVRPVKTEKVVRGISEEINDDGQNMNRTETVTVEEFDDGGTRTITTKTTENLIIGTPVVTEKVIRNISREISSEGQNNRIKGVTIEEITHGGGKKVTKETSVKENVTGIPVRTERFTRGISREMGNLKPRSSSKEIITKLESPGADTRQEVKQETIKTERIEKESATGIPVYTKVTRSFSKGRIQNVEMSRTIEWKPADEVRTKNFSRSFSEKVTKKELKDAGKYDHGVVIKEVTDENDNSIEENNTPKDSVVESKIKDTVKEITGKITKKKVTEYKTEEQVTNVEKTTYTLSSNMNLDVDRDLKASREIGTQMSIDGKPVDRNFKFVKEFGTQMSVEGKSLGSPFDRDFKLAKERNLARKIANSSTDGHSNASKEFGTQVSTVEKTVYSSVDGKSKVAREFGTQMSVVGKIVSNDTKISKEIGTQMSLDGTKQITTSIESEKSEIVNNNLPTKDKTSDIAEVTILKGNVSRLKDKIAKETVVVSKAELGDELPKKKSVLSKIAIFESLEKEPEIELPTRKIKCKYVPPNLNRTNSADRPKIVDELLKAQTQSEPLVETDKVEITEVLTEQPQFEPLINTAKVEICENYDEVMYRSEPALVHEYDPRLKQVNIETIKIGNIHSQQETKDFEIPTILPGIVDFKAQESQIESKTIANKAQIQREPSVIEMPTIFPARINYEAEIGRTKPGKINLNVWSTQVELNKSSVDKIDVFKEESLQEIAQTLPGKVDFKTHASHVPVSRDLPGTVDLKYEENQAEEVTILPAKIDFESEEVAETLVGRFDGQNGLSDIAPGITLGYFVDDFTTLPAKIDLKSYEIQTETAAAMSNLPGKVLPGKFDIDVKSPKPAEPEFAKTLTAFGFTPIKSPVEKEVNTKPKPGKINLSLWQTKVETNKTLVGKHDIKKTKDAEMAKALSGRVNFNNKPRERGTVQSNYVLNQKEYKADIARTSSLIGAPISQVEEANTLPGKIEFDFTENHEVAKPLLGFVDFSNNETQEATVKTLPDTVNFSIASSQEEVATILPGTVEFSSSENLVEEPVILIGKIEFDTEFVNNESKAEISEASQDFTYFSTTELEGITSFSEESNVENVGKLDLKAWEHQVEVNKTLVDKTDVVKSEHFEEIAKTLPGKIDFIKYDSVGEGRTFQAPINSNTDDNKVEITELDDDLEPEVEVAQILPAAVEFDPFKHTPRFNPLPMLMRLNSQENKVHLNENAQGDNERRDSVYKVDIPIDFNPGETLSDPELVDEDPPEVKAHKDSIIGNIKRKLYFITNKNNSEDSPNTPMNTPVPVEFDDDNNYERRVDELQTKTYSMSDFSHKSNEVKTVSSATSTAADTYEITAETIEESYSYSTTDNSATEYELNQETNTVQNETVRPEDDFITSPRNYEYHEEFERTKLNRNVTAENGFNFDTTHALTRSAYEYDDFKKSTEELKRAKSLAELDLGDVVQGKVKMIIGRIKSVDFSRRESVKTEISVKELPKRMTVMEKIALFEGKTARTRHETSTVRQTTTKKLTTHTTTEEEYKARIQELNTGKIKYGRMESMLYLPLADGREIPVLALGTALMDPRLIPHLIGAAIDMGYRAIDTAYIYGNEKLIGQGIKAKIDDGTVRREDLFIMSKLWSTYHKTDLVEVACKASLENLGLDYFDLYMIHNPMSFKEGADPIPKIATVLQYSEYDYLDAWFGMEGLISKGLAKSIGVSNFNSQQIQRILDKGKLKPVVNQVECHPYLSQQRLHSYCAERNILLSCFGVLGSKGTPADLKNSTTPVIDDPLIKVMASGLGVTPAQLLVRYQIESGHNAVAKASSAAHLWDNLQALTFRLEPSQMDALNALNMNRRTFAFTGMGDTHRNYPFLAPY